jgi:diguanylate cyclase (GGDEF)-like protein
MGAGGYREGRSRQVAILLAVQVAGSLVSFLFILAPVGTDTMTSTQQATLGVLWAVLAAFTYAGMRFLHAWFIEVSLVASGLLLALSVIFTLRGQVQVLDGVGLIFIGVFAAYQLPGWRVIPFLVITSAAYLAAVVANPVLGGIWVAAFVVVIFILNTLHVGYLVSRLRETAVTDPLTGAMNRKGLFDRAKSLRSVADRGGRPTAVVVLDLDQFKQFNDKYGHAAGDRLLADLVAAWSTVLRPSDLIARMGGDEFVLLLPNCDSDQAEAMLGRLRDVSGSGWTSGAVQWEAGTDILSAVDAADRVMYEGKRNRAPR